MKMNSDQLRAFEELTRGLPPSQKEQVRKELEQRLEDQAEAAESYRQALRAQHFAQLTQNEINTAPRRQYAVIAAVDLDGGFSKDGQIPWDYPSDLQWFKEQTTGHICVMGRTTYNDINSRLGVAAEISVLPNRDCFVITSTPLPRNNAVALGSIGELDKHLPVDDVSKIVFFIGGERIYREGIAKADRAFITVVNKEVDADKFFPVKYLNKNFKPEKMYQSAESDIRFTTWKRT